MKILQSRAYSRLLELLLLGIFAFSVYTKLIDVRVFELSIHSQMSVPWDFMEITARLLIIIELVIVVGLGFSLFLNWVWVRRGVFGFLFVLAIYLAIHLMVKGNQENCACFSDVLKLDTISSIIKNAVVLLLMLPVIKTVSFNGFSKKIKFWFLGIAVGISVMVFVLFPISPISINNSALINPIEFKQSNLAVLDSNQQVGLGNKYKMAVVVKPLCPHCKAFAKDLNQLALNDSSYNAILFLMASRTAKNIANFEAETNNKLDYISIPNSTVMPLCGGTFPVFYYIDNDLVYGPLLTNRYEVTDFKSLF